MVLLDLYNSLLHRALGSSSSAVLGEARLVAFDGLYIVRVLSIWCVMIEESSQLSFGFLFVVRGFP